MQNNSGVLCVHHRDLQDLLLSANIRDEGNLGAIHLCLFASGRGASCPLALPTGRSTASCAFPLLLLWRVFRCVHLWQWPPFLIDPIKQLLELIPEVIVGVPNLQGQKPLVRQLQTRTGTKPRTNTTLNQERQP